MNKDEVLILKPQFPVKAETMYDIHKKLIEQAKTGVVLIPFGYEVVIAPKDVEIKLENHESSSPWFFVDNPNYSSFYSDSKEMNIICDGCGKTIETWDDNYTRCPYCGKKHTFGGKEG